MDPLTSQPMGRRPQQPEKYRCACQCHSGAGCPMWHQMFDLYVKARGERDERLVALASARFALQNREKAHGVADEPAVWEAVAEAALGDVRAAMKPTEK